MTKIKVNKLVIFYILLLIPFFKPVGPSIYGIYNLIFGGWKLISTSILLVHLFRIYNGKLPNFSCDKWFVGIAIFLFVFVLNCMRYNSKNLLSILFNAIIIIGLMLLFSNTSKNKRKNAGRAIEFIFTLWLLLFILSVFYIKSGHVIFEDLGTDYTYFLGTDNYSAFATIPMLGVVIFFNSNKKDIFSKIKLFILSMGLCVSYIYTKAVSAGISTIILVILCIIGKHWNKMIKILTINRVMIAAFLLLVLIIKYDIQNYFLHLISFLGKAEKGSTLNSRTIIWNMALNLVRLHPFLGIGELSTESIENYVLYGVEHAHNLFLDLLIKTGFVGLIAYLYFYIGVVSRYIKKIRTTKGIYLIFTMIAFCILSMLDDYPFMPYIYVCIGILWGYGKYETRIL